MSSYLLVSPISGLADEVLAKCRVSGARIRQVSSIENARKWLLLQPHRGILVDQSFFQKDIVSLFVEAWERDSETVCALVAKQDIFDDARAILSLGVEDCCGEDCVSLIATLIDRTPEPTTLNFGQHSAVMVVDDLDSPRSIICTLIESFGYRDVVAASSVDTALELLRNSPFRFFAIVTDLNMPGRSGISLIQEIRETLSIAYLPVIVLTSDPSEENLLSALKHGVTAFLAKPPKKVVLKAELEKAKRLVSLGRDPQIGSPEELRLLERSLRVKIPK